MRLQDSKPDTYIYEWVADSILFKAGLAHIHSRSGLSSNIQVSVMSKL